MRAATSAGRRDRLKIALWGTGMSRAGPPSLMDNHLMDILSRLCRVFVVAITVAISVTLAGCQPTPSDASPAPSESSDLDALCSEQLVVSCESGTQSVLMTVSRSATAEETIDLARRLHTLAAAGSLQAGATLQGESIDAPVLDAEWVAPAPWTFTAYPGDPERIDAGLTDILTVAAVPGTLGISVFDAWPSVTIADLAQFDDIFLAVKATPLFKAGGTYTLLSLNEHLRIVHVPKRTTDDAIYEIIDIARTYPDAEVLLEAPTAGPQFPTLYVSRLTAEQVSELDARLRDPRLATADVDGYALEFVLGSTGVDGTSYTGGTFGNVTAD